MAAPTATADLAVLTARVSLADGVALPAPSHGDGAARADQYTQRPRLGGARVAVIGEQRKLGMLDYGTGAHALALLAGMHTVDAVGYATADAARNAQAKSPHKAAVIAQGHALLNPADFVENDGVVFVRDDQPGLPAVEGGPATHTRTACSTTRAFCPTTRSWHVCVSADALVGNCAARKSKHPKRNVHTYMGSHGALVGMLHEVVKGGHAAPETVVNGDAFARIPDKPRTRRGKPLTRACAVSFTSGRTKHTVYVALESTDDASTLALNNVGVPTDVKNFYDVAYLSNDGDKPFVHNHCVARRHVHALEPLSDLHAHTGAPSNALVATADIKQDTLVLDESRPTHAKNSHGIDGEYEESTILVDGKTEVRLIDLAATDVDARSDVYMLNNSPVGEANVRMQVSGDEKGLARLRLYTKAGVVCGEELRWTYSGAQEKKAADTHGDYTNRMQFPSTRSAFLSKSNPFVVADKRASAELHKMLTRDTLFCGRMKAAHDDPLKSFAAIEGTVPAVRPAIMRMLSAAARFKFLAETHWHTQETGVFWFQQNTPEPDAYKSSQGSVVFAFSGTADDATSEVPAGGYRAQGGPVQLEGLRTQNGAFIVAFF